MFGFKNQHRADLIEAQEKTLKAQKMVIDVLAEQVEWLRYQLSGMPHVGSTTAGLNPTDQPVAEVAGRKYLSEEEEDLLALRLNEHITDEDLRALSSELGIDADISVE